MMAAQAETIDTSSTTSLVGLQVLVVGINFPPEPTGIAPYNGALAQALATAGAHVTVVTGVPHYPTWKVQGPYGKGVRHLELNRGVRVKRRRHFVPKRAGLAGRAVMEGSFFLHALPSVLRSNADIIIAVTPSLSGAGAAAAGRRGRPLGVLVQDFTGAAVAQTDRAGSKAAKLIAWLERVTLKRATRLGVIATAFIRDAEALDFSPDQISVLPNFSHVTKSESSAAEARAALGWPVDRHLVVHTGNMGYKQGLRHIIEAARLAEGSDVTFVLVGAGNQREALRAQAEGLTNVMFVDPLTDEQYPVALAAADTLLLSEEQGVRAFCLPSKLTSYVVAERPMLAAIEADGITAREVGPFASALVVPPANPAALVDAIDNLRQNPQLRERLIDGARRQGQALLRADAMDRYVAFAADLAYERAVALTFATNGGSSSQMNSTE